MYVGGDYSLYRDAVFGALAEYGLSADYVNDEDYSIILNENTKRIMSYSSVCEYTQSGVLSITDYTGLRESLKKSCSVQALSELSNAGKVKAERACRWLVEPTIKADDINPIICYRPTFGDEEYFTDQDYNSSHRMMYDRFCAIRQGDSYGLISYTGLPLSDVMFESVDAGYDNRYVLFCGYDNDPDGNDPDGLNYTLSERYELQKLDDLWRVTGTCQDSELVWVDEWKNVYLFAPDGVCSRMNDHANPYLKAVSALYADRLYGDDNAYDERREGYLSANDAPDYVERYILLNNGKPIDGTVYDRTGRFVGGVIPVCLNNEWGYSDTAGNMILPMVFDGCWDLWCNSDIVDSDGGHYAHWLSFDSSDGYIVVRRDGKYAMYDAAGRLVIDYGVYEELQPVYEGMFWEKQNGLWGVVAIESDASASDVVLPQAVVDERSAKVASSNGLRLREGPGTKYCVIGLLSNGRALTACGKTGDWTYVRVGDTYGWVLSDYISK